MSSANRSLKKDAVQGTLNASLNYCLDSDSGCIIRPGTVKDKLREYDIRQVRIEDIRGREREFRLDVHGFQHIRQATKQTEFSDRSNVTGEYYAEVEALLKRSTGATKVLPFSHIIRRDSREAMLAACIGKGPTDIVPLSGPAGSVHIDQSYTGAEEVLRQNVDATEADRLSRYRWGIINVWRPIRTVERSPLAICDARSVREEELREVMAMIPKGKAGGLENVSTGNGFPIWNVAFGPGHAWYWASNMTPEDFWLIKCYDSSMEGKARRTPHSAFELPGQDGSMKGRESIEVRCLVFWENEPATI